jgi:nitric oxide reductase subunit C
VNWNTARWIFYLGTFISLVLFLGLTVDTHRQIEALTNAERLSSEVIAGKKVWQKYNCNDCHTILGFGSYYGPDMTKVYWRRGAAGIKAVIRTPEQFTTWRKMPRLALVDQEMNDLVAFLQWTSDIDTQDWPPQDQKFRPAVARAVALGASPGALLFQEKGCFACHRIYETGGQVGPELTHVGTRLDYQTIENILTDPRSVNAQATMPPTTLSHEERDELSAFLAKMK